jgi:regulator of RNase E activity RraA
MEPAAVDLALVERLALLHPAVVSDCLDAVGLRGQVLHPRIRPLYPDAKVAGVAATVRCVAVDGVPEQREEWYRGEIAAIDALRPGEVMVVSTCEAAYFGELLATAARARGARGIVMDAFTRDSLQLIEMRFPTFVTGIHCADALGRIDVAESGGPIECGGVTVSPGDLVLGDHDGVVAIPAAVALEVVEAAERKVARESEVRARLAEGMPVAEAFRRYGIL